MDEIEIKSKNINDISFNDISYNSFQTDHVLPNLFNEILNWSNERYNNSPEENFNTLLTRYRHNNPYSIINRSIYNREQYEEEQIQRAIMASLNLDNDDHEPEEVD